MQLAALAVYNALETKQDTLKDANAGNGIAIGTSGTNQVISAVAGDTTITVDENGIKVGTIAQSQVTNLTTDLAAKTTIAAKEGATNVYTIADGKTDDTHVSKYFYDVTGTNNAIDDAIDTASAAYAKLATANNFTANQQFGAYDTETSTQFNAAAYINADGTAAFGDKNANGDYALEIATNGVTANQALNAAAGLTVGTDYGITSGGVATLGATTVSSLTMGANTAASITPATGETTGALSLATANYAVEQAKAAADNAIQVSGDNISFYNSSSTTTPEATTYTADAIGTGYSSTNTVKADIASKQAQLYYEDANNTAHDMNAKVVTEIGTAGTSAAAATASDANLASELAVAKALSGKADNFQLGNGFEFATTTDPKTLNLKLRATDTPTGFTSGLVADANGLGVDLATPYTTGQTIEAWVGNPTAADTGNFYKIANVGTTFAVFSAKLLDVQNDLLFGDASNAGSIAYSLAQATIPGSDPAVVNPLQKAVKDLADAQADARIQSAATAGTGLTWTAAPTAEAAAKLSVAEEVFNTTTPTAPTAAHTFYDAQTIFANFALKNNPGQTIVAQEVDTKALKVANPLDSATPILEAKYNTTTQKNEIALNGATTVTGGLTANTFTMGGNQISGFALADNTGLETPYDNSKLATSGYVDQEFDTKVGTLTKENATTQGKYDTVSVADMIGVDANGEFKFDESLSNLYYGDGETPANYNPRTIRGAFVNLNSALGKIHGLAENSADGVKVKNDESIFKNGDINSAVTGVTTKVGSNLKVGTSVEELEVSLDNAIGNIQAGNTVVGKAYADQFGNLIDTTYAKDTDVVHKAGAETITGVKTFTSVVNANAGVKIGNDWQIDENGNKAFVIRDASTYFNAGSDGLVLKDITTATATTPAKNYFAATKTNLSTYANGSETFRVDNATGNVTAKGNVQAAGLAFAGAPTVIATAIDAGSATNFDREVTSKDAETLATLKSVDNLAEKAHYTNTTSGLTADTIGGAIDELQAKKQAQLYYMDGSTKKPMNAEVKTTIAAAASAEDANLVTEKAIRTELDNITNGTTPFTGFTMAKNTATSATDTLTMEAIDDGTYADQSTTTFATNLSVKSAVNKLVFGGNPNIWTGVNEFQNTLKVTKENGSGPRKVLFQVDTASGDTTIASLLLGSYETAMNGIDLMPTLNSYNHLVTSGGVYDALQGTGTAGETIRFGSRAHNIVIGKDGYKMAMNTETGVTTIGDGTTAGNVIMDHGKLSAGTSVTAGTTDTSGVLTSGAQMKSDGSIISTNGTKVATVKYDGITLSEDGTAAGNVFTVDGHGSVTAGQATDGAQFVLDTQNGTANINTAKTNAIKAAITADGDSAAMSAQNGSNISGVEADGNTVAMIATNGTNNYGVVADITGSDKTVFAGITKENGASDTLISGLEVEEKGVGMGLGDTNGKLVAGLSVKKVDDTQNTVELGAFDNTNNKLDTGV